DGYDGEVAADEWVVIHRYGSWRRDDLDDSTRLRTLRLGTERRVLVRHVLAADGPRLDEHVAEGAGPARTPGGRGAADGHRTRCDADVESRSAAWIARCEDPRDVQSPAAVEEERTRGVRHEADALLRPAGRRADVERLQTAVHPLEVGEVRDQARLARRRTAARLVAILHRSGSRHAGKAGRARRCALDGLGAEADLFDVDTRGEILGHCVAPYGMTKGGCALVSRPGVSATVRETDEPGTYAAGASSPVDTGSGAPAAGSTSSGRSQRGSGRGGDGAGSGPVTVTDTLSGATTSPRLVVSTPRTSRK